MKANAKQALEQAMTELHIPEQSLSKGKKYSIVELCNEYLQLPLEETVSISRELLHDMPEVYVLSEANWGDTLQNGITSAASRYGDKIRATAQNKFGVGATGNAPQMKQGWNRPLAKIGQGVQNFFNTKGAALRNSPMLRVDDNAKGVTKYIAFPDLSLDRPGHKRVLDAIAQGMSKDGKTVTPINVAAPERAAAQQAGNYAEINTPDDGENKKQAVEAALQQLEDLITNNKDQVAKYSFMSAEELEDIQKQISQAAGQAARTINNAQQGAQAETATMAQEAGQAADQPSAAGAQQAPQAGQPAQAEPNAYSNELNNIQSAASMAAQQAATSTAAAEAPVGTSVPPNASTASSNPDDNVIDAEIVPPEGQAPNPTGAASLTAPGTMPTLGTIQNQAGDLAQAAQNHGVAATQTAPVNAQAAAEQGTNLALNPSATSANVPGANFNFSGTPQANAPTPLPSAIQPTEPPVATGGEQPSLAPNPIEGTPVSPNGPLASQLANQPQGTIDDTLAAHQANMALQQRPGQPPVVNPADPNSLPLVNPEDLPKPGEARKPEEEYDPFSHGAHV